jgi:hypothetical protein
MSIHRFRSPQNERPQVVGREEKKKICTCVSTPTPTFPVLSAGIRRPRSEDRSEQLAVMAIIVLIVCEK